MTPQQRDALNRFLAERVMGFQDRTGLEWNAYGNAKPQWKDANNNYYMRIPSYCQSWADCEPLLDKIEQDKYWWDWQRGDTERYWFAIEEAQNLHEAYGSTRTEALCLAIAKIYGWKEDV